MTPNKEAEWEVLSKTLRIRTGGLDRCPTCFSWRVGP